MYVLPLLFSVLLHLFVFFIIVIYAYDSHTITKPPQQVEPIKAYLVESPKHVEQKILKSKEPKPRPPKKIIKKAVTKVQKKQTKKQVKQQTGSKLIASAFRQLAVENSKEGVYNKAVVLQKIEPQYPILARQNLWTGKVIIRIHISTEGICSSAEIAQSSGYQVLDRAALQSVYQWRFKPAQEGRRAIVDTLLVPFIFDLVR